MAAIRAIKSCKVCGRPGVWWQVAQVARLVWDPPPGVSKRRGRPVRGRVAGRARAGRRETGAGMVRYISAKSRSAVPLRRVATVAIGRRHGGTCVAQIAGHRDVRAGQRESGGAVVKRSRPATRSSCGRMRRSSDSQSDVVRHRPAQRRGALQSRGVAAVAIRRQRAAVVSIHMAQRAGDGRVRPGQRECGRAVIERRCRPICRGMADRTIGREAAVM